VSEEQYSVGETNSFAWLPSPTDTLVVSLAYVVSFLLVHYFLYPAQTWLLGGSQVNASLLFLPHGVTILTAWLLSWRSIIALAPGALAAQVYLLGELTFSPTSLLLVTVGISVAAATFQVFRLAGWNLFADQRRSIPWRGVMLVGLVASVADAALTNMILGSSIEQYLAHLLGDFFGLFAVMTVLMLFFRSFDRLSGLRS
jgi:hypothetical protein